METPLMIDQHLHGAFGIDFNKASESDEILFVAENLKKIGIGGFFPTLVTDSVQNIKKQIQIIKKAAESCDSILGIHLEGIFINPEKKGIHNSEHFMELTIKNYRKLEDDFIKIVTLAPELCSDTLPLSEGRNLSDFGEGLINYLRLKNIKIQAGHCTGGDLTGCTGATHLFNAMSGVTHRGSSTALSGLVNDYIYTAIIADGIHVSDEALKLTFKAKPSDKVILISDCLPITKSELKSMIFAGEKVYYDGTKATSKEGTLAGSTTLLPDIIKRLAKQNMFNPEYINNPYKYHNIDLQGYVEWDNEWNIAEITRDNQTLFPSRQP